MQLLPTTMVGSYPRPLWFTQQLAGRDVLEAFKIASHAEAFHDATRVVIKDQEEAGLDILTDGQMWFDDYNMGIGSFLWYWLERTKGFSAEKLPHPARAKAKGRDIWALDEAGGVAVEGAIERGPVRMALIYRWAQRHTQKPIKACVGAGPVQLRRSRTSAAGPVKNRYELSQALADVFRAEIARARRGRLQARPARGPRRVDAAPLGRQGLGLGQRDRRSHDGRHPARASNARGTSAWATRGATSSRA